MKYEGKQLQRMLAAEYVLGTLSPRARRRFRALLASRPALQAEVAYWEQRLGSLAHNIQPVTPRETVWAGLEQTIKRSSVTALPVRSSGGVAQSLWRGWAVAASLAAGYFGYQFNALQNQPPQVVEVPVEKIVRVIQPMPYVAVLQPGGDAKYTLALSPEKGTIRVAVAGNHQVDVSKHCLELWVIGDDAAPHSLGVLPDAGEGEMPMPKGLAMPKGTPTLAVSLEPRGGSQTGLPTGPVVTSGTALRL